MPVLHEAEVMVHDSSRTIGLVVETVYPPDNKLERFQQVLKLTDGTRSQFRMVELRPASEGEIESYWDDFKRHVCSGSKATASASEGVAGSAGGP